MTNTSTKKKILIIDDFADNISLEYVLKNKDFYIYHASSIDSAFQYIDKGAPDVIMMDILLKNRTAYEILRELKETPVSKDIPVIILSKINTPEHIEEAYMLGAKAYITKPCAFDKILDRIEKVISKARLKNKQKELHI